MSSFWKSCKRPLSVFSVLGAILLGVGKAEAQSGHLVSLQVSATGLVTSEGTIGGSEAQVRFTGGRGSLGLGYQIFQRDEETAEIYFVEPRYRIGSRGVAMYGAARVGYIPASDGDDGFVIFGGGGGFLVALSGSLALDLGAQVYSSDFSSAIAQLRLGLSIGL